MQEMIVHEGKKRHQRHLTSFFELKYGVYPIVLPPYQFHGQYCEIKFPTFFLPFQ